MAMIELRTGSIYFVREAHNLMVIVRVILRNHGRLKEIRGCSTPEGSLSTENAQLNE